jgi:hypothetical protein
MAFKNFVEEARKNTPQKIFRREDEIQNLIDCTGAKAVYVTPKNKVCWEECKFLKKAGSQKFCTEFLCLCSEDKCGRAQK